MSMTAHCVFIAKINLNIEPQTIFTAVTSVDHKLPRCICKCVYVCVDVDRVGFISDVFAIVVQISDVKRSKLAIF